MPAFAVACVPKTRPSAKKRKPCACWTKPNGRCRCCRPSWSTPPSRTRDPPLLSGDGLLRQGTCARRSPELDPPLRHPRSARRAHRSWPTEHDETDSKREALLDFQLPPHVPGIGLLPELDLALTGKSFGVNVTAVLGSLQLLPNLTQHAFVQVAEKTPMSGPQRTRTFPAPASMANRISVLGVNALTGRKRQVEIQSANL